MIAIAAVIAAATAGGFLSEQRWAGAADALAARANRALLYLVVPLLVFLNIVHFDPSGTVAAGVGFGLVALAVTLSAGYVIGTRVLRLPRPSVGALMLAAGFGNTAYLGLPVASALFGSGQLPNAIVYDLILTTMSVFTVGVAVAAAFGTLVEDKRERFAAVFTRNPPLWACALGLVAPAALAPDWAIDASHVLVYAVLPLGFWIVGVTLAAEAEEDAIPFPPPFSAAVATAVGLRLLLAPAVVLLLSLVVVDVPDAFISQAAMPCAVAALLLANEFGLNRALVASAIAWSTAIGVAAGLVVALV